MSLIYSAKPFSTVVRNGDTYLALIKVQQPLTLLVHSRTHVNDLTVVGLSPSAYNWSTHIVSCTWRFMFRHVLCYGAWDCWAAVLFTLGAAMCLGAPPPSWLAGGGGSGRCIRRALAPHHCPAFVALTGRRAAGASIFDHLG